jgi:N-glycosylase/DNA lyase
MRIDWIIEDHDIARVKAFFEAHGDNCLVRERIKRNLRPDKLQVTVESFWEILVGCLLTTQQKSGPGKPVTRFINTRPHPLPYQTCCERDDLAEFAFEVFKQFGGLRRTTRIGNELAANIGYLKDGGWPTTLKKLENVRLTSTPDAERDAADFLADHFKGLGPKQSRLLLQWTGLASYEIPIDSRITRWLNDFGFPFKVTIKGLSDRNYFNLVSDGFQKLSEASGIKPCVLDAAIFASYDEGGWTEENMTY